jgi:putative mRNA 3-end processing factor
MARLGSWIEVLFRRHLCAPADAWIDPSQPKNRALVTHGHADHARGGHGAVLATPETLAIMALRYGEQTGSRRLWRDAPVGDVDVSFVPAGHVLGSAQIVLEHGGERIVVSGDYKRRADPTCAPFEPVPCDVFITEATFGLPVFRHPDTASEIDRLLTGCIRPVACVLVGAYALGKAQRVIAELRRAGHHDPIYITARWSGCARSTRSMGVELGELRPATGAPKDELKGRIVVAPAGRSQRPLVAAAARSGDGDGIGLDADPPARAAVGVELPLVISDHADWDELTCTIRRSRPAKCGSPTAARKRSSIGAPPARSRRASSTSSAMRTRTLHPRFGELIIELGNQPLERVAVVIRFGAGDEHVLGVRRPQKPPAVVRC